jgi:putative ABC transport system permease protein
MTAAMPGLTLSQLWSGLSYAEGVLQVISVMVILVGLLSMVVALYNSLQERRREMAILRALGARPWLITAMLLAESAIITGSGIGLSLVFTYGSIVATSDFVGRNFGIHLPVTRLAPDEALLLGAMFLTGLLMAAAPARRAYRNAIVDGLTIRI